MTESSPCTVGMMETRKSIVRPRTRSLKRPSCGNALLGDVELRHDLDARNDRAVVALVDRVHGLVEDAVDAVLDDDDVFLRLDVDVRGAALDGVEDDRVDELDDRRGVLRDPVDREGLLALLVLGDELHPEVLGGLVEDALRGLALLEEVADERPAADLDPQREPDVELELVEAHDVGRVGADDRHHAVGLALGHEGVAEHPLDRDRAEEVGVDAERGEVDVREVQPLGERDRLRLLLRAGGKPDFVLQLLGHGTSFGART